MAASDHLNPEEFGRRLTIPERKEKDPDSFWSSGLAFREPRRIEEMFNDNPFLVPEGTPRYDVATDTEQTTDHLGGQRFLYHGTDREFQTGEHIRPRTKNVAHATPSLRTAQVFGKHTYEVEPLNRTTTWNRPMKYTQGEHHTETLSEEGFRVRRRIDGEK